ncbi:MAG: enoyl-CoA hydratase-related protein [Prochloraceae cyanobacterium]
MGVTAIQADREMDAGDIWASVNFEMQPDTKSTLYRGQIANAAIEAILETIENFQNKNFFPEPLDYKRKDVKGCWRNYMKQTDRAIDWGQDSVATIVKKIRSADSQPGLLDTIDGEKYYLYGAHPEDKLKGNPGEIIAQRHGAICRAAVDGAVWITHLKQKKQGDRVFFKLPAAMVLGDLLKNVPEVRLSLEITSDRQTFREIWYEESNDVGYLHFEFYNGAMNTDQCQRLRQAYLWARKRDTKVIALMGGRDFWSNGIHLNVIEASSDPASESWQNINAIDDLVYEILTTDTHLTISALQANAAAGGVMMALAADRIYARQGIVFNPHYKRMGLYGSEYWTYSLPKRVGLEKAREITDICMPMGTQVAKDIGLIDNYFGKDPINFQKLVKEEAEKIARSKDYQEQLWLKNKKRALDEDFKPLSQYRSQELERMKIDFKSENYNTLRYNFVHKISPSNTPLHLAKHRQPVEESLKCQVIMPKNQSKIDAA